MKQVTLPVTQFKAKCLRLLDEVAEHGNSLIITKRGRPIARVAPVTAPGQPLRGSWKGIFKAKGDVVHFDAAGDWESAR
jgi:prevent-host-death family protein